MTAAGQAAPRFSAARRGPSGLRDAADKLAPFMGGYRLAGAERGRLHETLTAMGYNETGWAGPRAGCKAGAMCAGAGRQVRV